MTRAVMVATAMLALAYPLAVYWGLNHWSPRWIAVALATVLLLRLIFRPLAGQRAVLVVGAALAALAWVSNDAVPLKLYPAAVSAVLLVVFGLSLLRPPSVVERIARLRDPNLSPRGIAYTRHVTQAWCAFFIFNGGVALATALAGSDVVWALYNGLVSYVLIGVMFAAEWWIRRRLLARRPND